MARTLVVVRHAKAQPSHPLGDHARELAPRGVDDARALGRWLRQHDLLADLVLVSTAARARGTAEHVLAGADRQTEVEADRSIYDRGPEGVLEALRQAPREAVTVWVVGHQPSMGTVTSTLADPATSTPAALERLAEGFPTATAAVLRLDGDWSELDAGMARLESVHTARA